MTSEADLIREHSSQQANENIDREMLYCIEKYAGRSPSEITQRIQELEREWDVERVLELNASTLAFIGLALGVTHNRKWLYVPGVVLPFLFQHAVQGWCPPLPVIRRFGVRSRKEIDREKYALKALRGDFVNIHDPMEAAEAAR